MIKAVRIHSHGGPEVMRLEEIELPPPGPGEVRVRHTAIGLNFSDINVRRGGFYQKDPLPMPIILGNEASGVVSAVGDRVDNVKIGDRVGYCGVGSNFFVNTGAYAQERNVPAAR
ncbi:MAG TPA: alcohol dehydrogenase catalytic domain-containing protein, partial [Xanthobacteraceae bacterium]